jgi:H+/gluconate symporter-like permease
MLEKTGRYILLYAAWIVVLALGVWFLLLSRDAFLNAASILYARDSLTRTWQVEAADKFYTLIVGLLCLVLITVSEFYFRNGVRRGNLWRRFARVVGFELLLIFVADLVLLATQGWGMGAWSRWLILGAELVLGVLLLKFGRAAPGLLYDLVGSDSDDPDATAFS